MATSRDIILSKLRSAGRAAAGVEPAAEHLPVVPLPDLPPDQLLARFIEQAQKLGCEVHLCRSEHEALTAISGVLGPDKQVLAWNLAHIPLPGLPAMFEREAIQLASPRDEGVRVGITAVDAALASTGSLILKSGAGKPRLPSLLPPVHVAIVAAQQIVPTFEAWVAQQRGDGLDRFRSAASVILISGPSRTADIAMQLIMGMHGPGQLHVILLSEYFASQ